MKQHQQQDEDIICLPDGSLCPVLCVKYVWSISGKNLTSVTLPEHGEVREEKKSWNAKAILANEKCKTSMCHKNC